MSDDLGVGIAKSLGKGCLVYAAIAALIIGGAVFFFEDLNPWYEPEEETPPPFTSTIYLDKNTNGPRFGGDSIYYLEISGPDTGFVTPLATAWECAGSY